MRRTAKRLLLGVVVVLLATVGLGAPPALAAGDVIHGGCFVAAVRTNPTLTGGDAVGVIGDVSATTDSAGNSIPATVYCKIQVNGSDATPIYVFPGTDSAIGVGPVEFAADDTDVVQLCQRVVYGDGTDTGYSCRFVDTARVPPQEIYDVADGLVFPVVDPLVCPVLKTLAGNYPGGLAIKSDGDVYLSGVPVIGPIYDCPPYGNFTVGTPINGWNAPSATLYWLLPPGAPIGG
jgi:hypothetical protein